MKPACLKCGLDLHLLREPGPNCSWACPQQCGQPIDTGVSIAEDIAPFEQRLSAGPPHLFVVTPPIPLNLLPGAKVYAPNILIHFIQCAWGGCYNSIYNSFLVPHFDSPEVLDNVLRTPVIQAPVRMKDGIPEPKMFPELLGRLKGVRSNLVQRYLTATLPPYQF